MPVYNAGSGRGYSASGSYVGTRSGSYGVGGRALSGSGRTDTKTGFGSYKRTYTDDQGKNVTVESVDGYSRAKTTEKYTSADGANITTEHIPYGNDGGWYTTTTTVNGGKTITRTVKYGPDGDVLTDTGNQVTERINTNNTLNQTQRNLQSSKTPINREPTASEIIKNWRASNSPTLTGLRSQALEASAEARRIERDIRREKNPTVKPYSEPQKQKRPDLLSKAFGWGESVIPVTSTTTKEVNISSEFQAKYYNAPSDYRGKANVTTTSTTGFKVEPFQNGRFLVAGHKPATLKQEEPKVSGELRSYINIINAKGGYSQFGSKQQVKTQKIELGYPKAGIKWTEERVTDIGDKKRFLRTIDKPKDASIIENVTQFNIRGETKTEQRASYKSIASQFDNSNFIQRLPYFGSTSRKVTKEILQEAVTARSNIMGGTIGYPTGKFTTDLLKGGSKTLITLGTYQLDVANIGAKAQYYAPLAIPSAISFVSNPSQIPSKVKTSAVGAVAVGAGLIQTVPKAIDYTKKYPGAVVGGIAGASYFFKSDISKLYNKASDKIKGSKIYRQVADKEYYGVSSDKGQLQQTTMPSTLVKGKKVSKVTIGKEQQGIKSDGAYFGREFDYIKVDGQDFYFNPNKIKVPQYSTFKYTMKKATGKLNDDVYTVAVDGSLSGVGKIKTSNIPASDAFNVRYVMQEGTIKPPSFIKSFKDWAKGKSEKVNIRTEGVFEFGQVIDKADDASNVAQSFMFKSPGKTVKTTNIATSNTGTNIVKDLKPLDTGTSFNFKTKVNPSTMSLDEIRYILNNQNTNYAVNNVLSGNQISKFNNLGVSSKITDKLSKPSDALNKITDILGKKTKPKPKLLYYEDTTYFNSNPVIIPGEELILKGKSYVSQASLKPVLNSNVIEKISPITSLYNTKKDNRFSSRPSFILSSTSKTELLPNQITNQKPASTTKIETIAGTKPTTSSKSIYESRAGSSTSLISITNIFPTSPTIPTITPAITSVMTPELPRMPGFNLPSWGNSEGYSKPPIKLKQLKGYKPTLFAGLTGFKGTSSKVGITTGLGLRPIITKKKRKKR